MSRGRRGSELDLGIELELPEANTDPSNDGLRSSTGDLPATDPDAPGPSPEEQALLARHQSGVDAETELDLRLPDMTIPPTGAVRPPPSTLAGARSRGPEEPASLELARPVGRHRVVVGVRELEAPPSAEPSLELAREPRRPQRPPSAPRVGLGIKVLVVVLAVAAAMLGATLLGWSPRRIVEAVRPLGERALPLGEKVARQIPAALGGDDSMITVPAGTFARGCIAGDDACAVDERPPELLSMPALAVDRTEVTAAEYAACVAAGTCTPAGDRDPLCATARPEHARHPANCVDSTQAATFCRARGKRLPTASEWEFAARGGQTLVYPWGDDQPNCTRSNLGGCGGRPLPVGDRATGANAHGALDMAGNVWEWTADGTPERREIRGGSYLDGPRTLRTSNRGWADARTQIPELGFRCVD